MNDKPIGYLFGLPMYEVDFTDITGDGNWNKLMFCDPTAEKPVSILRMADVKLPHKPNSYERMMQRLKSKRRHS